MKKLFERIFAHWQTTLTGVLGTAAILIPPVKHWVETTTHVNALSILALAFLIQAALAADASKTPPTATP